MSSDTMCMGSECMNLADVPTSPPSAEDQLLMSEEERLQERKRDIVVLVLKFLTDYGYNSTYQSLCRESATSLDQVNTADNMDLMTIVQEFVACYHSKYGRYPRLIRQNQTPALGCQDQQQVPQQQRAQTNMPEAHAMQLQAALAAAQAAAKAKLQQQLRHQQQQLRHQQQEQQQHTEPIAPQKPQHHCMHITQQQMLPQQQLGIKPLMGCRTQCKSLSALSLSGPAVQRPDSESGIQSAGTSPAGYDSQLHYHLQQKQQQQQQQHSSSTGSQSLQQQALQRLQPQPQLLTQQNSGMGLSTGVPIPPVSLPMLAVPAVQPLGSNSSMQSVQDSHVEYDYQPHCQQQQQHDRSASVSPQLQQQQQLFQQQQQKQRMTPSPPAAYLQHQQQHQQQHYSTVDHHQQRRQQQQQQDYEQMPHRPQVAQELQDQAQQMQEQQQQQQQLQHEVLGKMPVERVRITYLDSAQGSTCKLGTTEPVNQVEFVAVLSAVSPDEPPSRHLCYKQPNKKHRCRKGSERLNTSDLQEEVMYALVGCSDVGWSSRKITSQTRQFLQTRYNIQTSTITTFFKNRSQRKPYSHPGASHSRRSSSGSGMLQRRSAAEKAHAESAATAAATLAAAGNLVVPKIEVTASPESDSQSPAAPAAGAAVVQARLQGNMLWYDSAAAAARGLTATAMPAAAAAACDQPASAAAAAAAANKASQANQLFELSPTPTPAANNPHLPTPLAPVAAAAAAQQIHSVSSYPAAAAALAGQDGTQSSLQGAFQQGSYSYGGLSGLGLSCLDSPYKQPSFAGLATSTSLACGFDTVNYLLDDLDAAAAVDVCCSPCSFMK